MKDNKGNKFIEILAVPALDLSLTDKARSRFFAFRDKGIFYDCAFDDDMWFTTDEVSRIGLDFSFPDERFGDFGKTCGITAARFRCLLKTFVVCVMGEISLLGLQGIVRGVKRIALASYDDRADAVAKTDPGCMNQIHEFFSLLPSEGHEKAMDDLVGLFDDEEDDRGGGAGDQRQLADFDSYFKFNDILKDFWASSRDEEEKLFFFPVWLWWNVSAILPLRPREFILTPRSCLLKTESGYSLTVRRNNIKGSGKKKSYKIGEDYRTCHYTIPEGLAKEIIWYQEETARYMSTDIDTLLVADTHYSKWGHCRPYTSRYFTYTNMRTCLRYFYEQIIHERYGYSICYDRMERAGSEEKRIGYLHLGDTRHLALINMIFEGATPMVAMVLAGHDNPEMSSWYFSNITRLIECRTYRQYKKMISAKQEYRLSGPRPVFHEKEFVMLEKGGRCYSPNALKGDYSDCLNALGPAGEIGFHQACSYYRSQGRDFYDGKDLCKERIMTECFNLQKIVRLVRNGRGEEEDIMQALMKLRDEDLSYQQYLIETMEEKNNG